MGRQKQNSLGNTVLEQQKLTIIGHAVNIPLCEFSEISENN